MEDSENWEFDEAKVIRGAQDEAMEHMLAILLKVIADCVPGFAEAFDARLRADNEWQAIGNAPEGSAERFRRETRREAFEQLRRRMVMT